MPEPTETSADPIDQVALLAEPVRRSVYDHVAAASGPVDRDETASAVGISRALAAFHLDRLVEGGLLDATFRRRSGRAGPGAGRPAKFYARPLARSVDVSLPPRRYDVAAGIFATGLDRARGGRGALLAAARDAGRAAASSVPAGARNRSRTAGRAALLGILRDRGFEPRARADGGIDLGNCPFKDLTLEHRELTCAANLALLETLSESIAAAGLVAERRDLPEPCCVALRAAESAGTLRGQATGA